MFFSFCLLLTFITEITAQIVPNGSFEESSCPYYYSCVDHWTSPTATGTPDYFHRSAGRVPNTLFGYQETQPSGDSAFVAIVSGKSIGTYNPLYREYLQVELNTPLTENECYKVKFYVNWAVSPGQCISYLKHMGAFLSGYAPTDPGLNVLQVIPQVVSDTWLNDSANWTLVEGCITVPDDSSFTFLTIGNFENEPDYVNVAEMGATEYRAYYFIDAVSIEPWTNPDPSFTFSTPKCGVAVQFTSTETGGNHFWDFGDGTTSQSANPDHQFGSGVFLVKHLISQSGCDCDTFTFDTVRMLDCCTCKGCGPNLVVNGDFTMPCGFAYASDLAAEVCPHGFTDPNEFTEAMNATLANGNWCGLDHTGFLGSKFLIADGQTDGRPVNPGPSARAWFQKVGILNEGKRYCFKAFVKNVCKDCPDKPSLKLQIEAKGTKYIVDAIEDLAFNECCDAGWTKMCGSWTAPAGVDSVELSILITKGLWKGNDAGIDDISFAEEDVPPSANFTKSAETVCEWDNAQFTSVNNSGDHQWTFGDGSSSNEPNPAHKYKNKGDYTITHIITTSCGKDTARDTVQVSDCCCTSCPDTLVYNGDFSASSCFTGYFTDMDLNHCDPLYSHQDSITEDSNAQSVISSWYGKDHTGIPGSRFLIVDFPTTVAKRAWYQTGITVQANTMYCFSMYVKNLHMDGNYSNAPSFDLRINGINGSLVKHVDSLLFDSSWMKVCGEWFSGQFSGNVELDLVVYPGTIMGNDLGVDDIKFSKKCTNAPAGNDPPPLISHPDDAEEDPNILVSPVPLTKGTALDVSYITENTGNIIIALYDGNGKMVLEQNAEIVSGTNHFQLPTHALSAGLYYLKITDGEQRRGRKIMVVEE